MSPGDVLLTPSWCWHAHESVGPDECFWVDVLDVPLVHLLEPMFFERHPDRLEKVLANVESSPIAFRWADSMKALDAASAPENGTAEREIELGKPAMKTVAIHYQRMASGFVSRPHRTTANAVFTVIEGEGRTRVAESEFAWKKGDVIAVPAWSRYQHTVSTDAHLVRVSDEPLMRAFDYLRTRDS
jgi:gentisate 1,2-dioxygenase